MFHPENQVLLSSFRGRLLLISIENFEDNHSCNLYRHSCSIVHCSGCNHSSGINCDISDNWRGEIDNRMWIRLVSNHLLLPIIPHFWCILVFLWQSWYCLWLHYNCCWRVHVAGWRDMGCLLIINYILFLFNLLINIIFHPSSYFPNLYKFPSIPNNKVSFI